MTTIKDIDGFRRPAIPLTQGFGCRLVFRVHNASDHSVTLDHVLFPFGGRDAGPSFKVPYLADRKASSSAGGTDSIGKLDQPLEPGQSTQVNVFLEFRASGCMSKGGSMTITPTIEVRDLLASHDVEVTDFPALVGTADSSCDT